MIGKPLYLKRVTERSQLQINWPYNTTWHGIVYLTDITIAQEKMMRRIDNSTDEDLVLCISVKTDTTVLVPIRTLIDF